MKSKLFSPSHEPKTQSPLGEPEMCFWPPQDERFGNTQDVPSYSTFGAKEVKAVPTIPIRRK